MSFFRNILQGFSKIVSLGGLLPDPLGDALFDDPQGPEAPGPVDPAPTRDEAAVAKAGEEAREEAKRRRGRRATVLSDQKKKQRKVTLGRRELLGS